MALRNGSSGGLGLLDLTSSWEAFENINQVTVRMELEAKRTGSSWHLWLIGQVWDGPVDSTGPRLLASERSLCSPIQWANLDVVAFRLLYALDAALASRELDGKRSLA